MEAIKNDTTQETTEKKANAWAGYSMTFDTVIDKETSTVLVSTKTVKKVTGEKDKDDKNILVDVPFKFEGTYKLEDLVASGSYIFGQTIRKQYEPENVPEGLVVIDTSKKATTEGKVQKAVNSTLDKVREQLKAAGMTEEQIEAVIAASK